MIKEFKEFISRGNVVDLAVGVIVGGAFSTIVSSLVEVILMPIIGMLLGGINFSNLSIKLGEAKIMYGNFLQNVIDFLIVAFCVFLFVKFRNELSRIGHKNKKKTKENEMIQETELTILKEIRDTLKKTTKNPTTKKSLFQKKKRRVCSNCDFTYTLFYVAILF